MSKINASAVAKTLQLKQISQIGNEEVYICPFCSNSQKQYPKFYLNPQKGVFICHHCHRSGSITDLWAMLTNTDTKTAYQQMINTVSEIRVDLDIKEPVVKPTASPEKLKRVYADFFDKLNLNKEHQEDLLRRGLPRSYFKHFRSIPEKAPIRWNICRELNRDYNLEDVPGFRKRISQKGKPYWDCIPGGMLIPIRDMKGNITSFQVRTGREPKYIFFSYAGQLKSTAHIIPGYGIPWVIEGVLKSYVVNYFLQIPCIGIPGTNTYKTIPVDKIRGNQIILAYDMENNPHTIEARQKATEYLESNGFVVTHAFWNPNLGKGIDDACLSLKKRNLGPTPAMFLSA